jgi:hypothetical protein
MRKTVTAQDPGGEQLVVPREERPGIVQDVHSTGGERSERPEAVVDSVERGGAVESAERPVSGTEDVERLLRRELLPDGPSISAWVRALLVEVDRPAINSSRTSPA